MAGGLEPVLSHTISYRRSATNDDGIFNIFTVNGFTRKIYANEKITVSTMSLNYDPKWSVAISPIGDFAIIVNRAYLGYGTAIKTSIEA